MYDKPALPTPLAGILIGTLILMLAPDRPALAADGAGNYGIWGQGGMSCHQYNKAHGTPAFDSVKAYVMGYLTAYNWRADDTYRATGDRKFSALVGWLDDYCELHQLDSLDRAVRQMIAAFHDTRLTVQPGAGGSSGSWGRAPAAPSGDAR